MKRRVLQLGIAVLMVVFAVACSSRPREVRDDHVVMQSAPVMAQDPDGGPQDNTMVGHQVYFSTRSRGGYLTDDAMVYLMRKMDSWQSKNPGIKVVDTQFVYYFESGYADGTPILKGVWIRFEE